MLVASNFGVFVPKLMVIKHWNYDECLFCILAHDGMRWRLILENETFKNQDIVAPLELEILFLQEVR